MTIDCPVCRIPLTPAVERTPYGRIEIDYCGTCRGVWFDALELAALLSVGDERAFASDSPLLEGERPSHACPRHPEAVLRERTLRMPSSSPYARSVNIDQCPSCEGVWLDGTELSEVAGIVRTDVAIGFLARGAAPSVKGVGVWIAQAVTGMPREQWNPGLRRPLVVATVIAACVVVFVLELCDGPDAACRDFGLVPAHFNLFAPWPLVSHMFLHAGLWHLAGNLWFLWVFGDNVEDRLGGARFALARTMRAGLCSALPSRPSPAGPGK